MIGTGTPTMKSLILTAAANLGLRVYWLPAWAPMGGITLPFGVVAVKEPKTLTTWLHELQHVEQRRRDGWIFWWRYVFSARWRVKYEIEAYRVNIARGWKVGDVARALSGPLYLWAIGYEEALRLLAEDTWR